jgi:hypothetical protein
MKFTISASISALLAIELVKTHSVKGKIDQGVSDINWCLGDDPSNYSEEDKGTNGNKVTGDKHKQIDDNLPHPEEWHYRPLYIQAAGATKCESNSNSTSTSLPIGIPINFESDLFKGKILIRIRDADVNAHHRDFDPSVTKSIGDDMKNYFKGKRRLRQYVVQGQFKKSINMSELYYGDFYEKPLRLVPPPIIEKTLKAVFNRIAPGIIMELTSEKPRVIVLMAGVAKKFSIDLPGNEPDIMGINLPENTSLIDIDLGKEGDSTVEARSSAKDSSPGFESDLQRKKKLSKPKHAAKYCYQPGKVYTFEHCDDVIDLSTYSIKIPIIKSMGLAKILGPQPTTIRASNIAGDQSIFNFNIFHERIYEEDEDKDVGEEMK